MKQYVPTFNQYCFESSALDAYLAKNRKKPKKVGKFEVNDKDIVLIQTPNPNIIKYAMIKFDKRAFTITPMVAGASGWVLDPEDYRTDLPLPHKELKDALMSGDFKIIDNFEDAQKRGEPLNNGKKIKR